MGCLSKFRLDKEKSVDGVWCVFGDGIEVKIARLRTPEFRKYYAKINEPYLDQIRRDVLDEKIQDELMMQAVAHCVIRNWKNMEDEQGKTIKYTPEKAFEIISDEANALFYNFIYKSATSEQRFYEEQKKATEKN